MYGPKWHYDSGTGWFTQQDPIGLAGGLNLYGYADGDPINFSDPFGLCPDSAKDKRGYCPGGLTDAQYDQIEYAANNRMTAEARDEVLQLLRDGRIHSVPYLRVNRKRAAGVTVNGLFGSEVTIDGTALDRYASGELAAVLTHELGHVNQGWWFSGNREADADAFSCANARERGRYFGGGYRRTLGPCGSGVP